MTRLRLYQGPLDHVDNGHLKRWPMGVSRPEPAFSPEIGAITGPGSEVDDSSVAMGSLAAIVEPIPKRTHPMAAGLLRVTEVHVELT